MRRSAGYYFLGNLFQRGYPFGETFLLTVLLPVEDFGRWSWAASFYVGVVSLTHGGIPAATLRYTATEKGRALIVLKLALRRLVPWAFAGMGSLFALGWTVPESIRWLVWIHLPAVASTLVAETVRSHLRGCFADRLIFLWQAISGAIGLVLTGTLTGLLGIRGMGIVRLLQPLWGLLPVAGLLWQTLRVPAQRLPGFGRFGWTALWGNLAMEAMLFLPVWLLGWRGASERTIAYWRWATLFPMSLRTILSQVILYFYPAWAQRTLSPITIYTRYIPLIHGPAAVGALLLGLAGIFWTTFPGEAYLPARPYYWLAIVAGYIWSTEALALPNILSARGYIRLFSRAYLGGLLMAMTAYAGAGENLYLLLLGLIGGGVTTSLLGLYFMLRLKRSTQVPDRSGRE